MKNIGLAVFILILMISSTGCNGEKEFTLPDYKNWKKPVTQVLDRPVPGHGATFRVIYANDIAFTSKIITDASGRKAVRMNDGSVIIKEVYKKREEIGYNVPEIVVMVKESADPEALNGWKYYMKKPGEKSVEVKSRMCIGCHEAANEKHPYFDENKEDMFRDYLFTVIAK